MVTSSSTRQTTPYFATSRPMRKFMAYSTITLFAFLVLLVFLMPLGYMTTTAFKSLQQIQDLQAGILPKVQSVFNYEGKDYPLYQVPTDLGTAEWALVKKGREASQFIDPANPGAGLIDWPGRWRTLNPVYTFSPTYTNFGEAWDTIQFPILFRNTVIIALSGTIGTLLSSICVAYGFSRFRFPGRNVLFMILIATIILPTQVTLIPKYIFFRNTLHWGGTWWPLIIPHFFANAYNVFFLRQFFRSIPKDMDEAAMIDGATPVQTLLYVIIPQSWAAIIAVGLFHFFWAWNDFFEPLVYLQGYEARYPIAVGLTQFANAFTSRPDLLMAASLMTIVVPIIIFFLAQRFFMQGIVITGVEK
jgi:multiple sugar transport system permease protein